MKTRAWVEKSILGLGILVSGALIGVQGAEKLPTAEEVLERFVEKLGGEEAFAAYQSQHTVGKIEMGAQQMEGTMEVFAARPDKLLVVIEMPGVGKITTGFNGEVGWMSNPYTGPMILPEEMLKQVATQADFDHALRKPEDYKTMENLGVETFAGEPCYKLKLVHQTGYESTEYFSKESGLQKGFTMKQESPFGEVNATTEITDYKQFGKILMPSRIVQKVSGMEQVVTVDRMEFNNVPASKFELPKEVKTLLEGGEEEGGEKPEKKEEEKRAEPKREN